MTSKELLGFTYRFEPAEGPRTLLLLHGTGGDENDLLPLGHTLDPRAHLLSPRGKVSEAGSPRFFRRFAEGVLDVEDLKERTHELAGFIEAAAEVHGFDASRIVPVGYSNGANIAASTLLLHPNAVKGAILFRPMVPFEPNPPPDLTGVSVFIGAARNDPLVDPQESERLSLLLAGPGAEVDLRWSLGGHELTNEDVAEAARWLGNRP